MGYMKYVLQKTEKSHCKYCNENVYLLIEEIPEPFENLEMFYICFDCKKVFQVGKGEVEEIKSDGVE